MPNGLPALAPSRGVNADLMFAEKITNENARFQRLENAVSDMRREFEAVKPAIVRLAAIESDMEELVRQLQTLLPGAAASGVPMPPAPQEGGITTVDSAEIPDIGPMPEAALEEKTPAKTAPKTMAPIVQAPVVQAQAAPKNQAAAFAAPTITGVRVGEHSGKTRIVIDASAKVAFTHNLDNAEKLLVIELPKAAWHGAKSAKQGANAPLLSSWSADASGDGHVIAIQLKNNAEIIKASTLNASGDAPFRIIFDLKTAP